MRESHCSHCPPCKADEKTSPWAAFSTRTGPGQWSGGQTSTWCGAGAEKWKRLGRVWGSLFCHFFFFDLLFFLIIFWPDALPVRVSGQIYKFHSSGPHSCCDSCRFLLCHIFFFFFLKYRLWIISSEQLHGQQHCGVKENLLSSYTPDQTLRWGTASVWIICHCEHPITHWLRNRWGQPWGSACGSAAAAALVAVTVTMTMRSSLYYRKKTLDRPETE